LRAKANANPCSLRLLKLPKKRSPASGASALGVAISSECSGGYLLSKPCLIRESIDHDIYHVASSVSARLVPTRHNRRRNASRISRVPFFICSWVMASSGCQRQSLISFCGLAAVESLTDASNT